MPSSEQLTPIAAVEPAPSPAMPPALQAWNEGVARLQHMPALSGFSVFAWAFVKRGCAELLLDWGAELERLGWSTCEVWGCHPAAPGPAVHVYGLGLLVRDGAVVKVSATGAIIKTATGVLQSYTRRLHPQAVPIWTLGSAVAANACPVEPNGSVGPAGEVILFEGGTVMGLPSAGGMDG